MSAPAIPNPLSIITSPFESAFKGGISGVFKDPFQSAVNIATAPIKSAVNFDLYAGRSVTNSLGLTQSREAKNAAEAEANRIAEETARSDLYTASTTDNSIDRISQRELVGLYQSGANSAKIASLLTAARQGKGIYAVRKINQAQMDYNKRNPGRSQLLGGGTLI